MSDEYRWQDDKIYGIPAAMQDVPITLWVNPDQDHPGAVTLARLAPFLLNIFRHIDQVPTLSAVTLYHLVSDVGRVDTAVTGLLHDLARHALAGGATWGDLALAMDLPADQARARLGMPTAQQRGPGDRDRRCLDRITTAMDAYDEAACSGDGAGPREVTGLLNEIDCALTERWLAVTDHSNLDNPNGVSGHPAPPASDDRRHQVAASLAQFRCGMPSTLDLIRLRDEVARLAAEITRETDTPVMAVSGPVDPYAPRWLSGLPAHVAWWVGDWRQAAALSALVRPEGLTGHMYTCESWREVAATLRFDLAQVCRRRNARQGLRWLAGDLRSAWRRGHVVSIPIGELPAVVDRLTAHARRVAR